MPRPSTSYSPLLTGPFSGSKQSLNAALREAAERYGMTYSGVHWPTADTIELWCFDGGNVRVFTAKGIPWAAGGDILDDLYDKLMLELRNYKGVALQT